MRESTVDFKRLLHDIKRVREGESLDDYIPTPAECQFILLVHDNRLSDEDFDYYLRIYEEHYPDDPWINKILKDRYSDAELSTKEDEVKNDE